MEDTIGIKEYSKKILNKAASRRLMPEQQACILLSGSPWTLCSGIISRESIAKNPEMRDRGTKAQPTRAADILGQYEGTPPIEHLKNMKVRNFCHYECQQPNLPVSIPYFTGSSGLFVEFGAMHLFFTKEKCCSHNLKYLAKTNYTANSTAVIQPIGTSSTREKGTRRHLSKELNSSALICRGMPVCTKNRNFLPFFGIHNGARGFVEEIVFAKGRNPNEGDLPESVVVHFRD